jgi:hypothetical protein
VEGNIWAPEYTKELMREAAKRDEENVIKE